MAISVAIEMVMAHQFLSQRQYFTDDTTIHAVS